MMRPTEQRRRIMPCGWQCSSGKIMRHSGAGVFHADAATWHWQIKSATGYYNIERFNTYLKVGKVKYAVAALKAGV